MHNACSTLGWVARFYIGPRGMRGARGVGGVSAGCALSANNQLGQPMPRHDGTSTRTLISRLVRVAREWAPSSESRLGIEPVDLPTAGPSSRLAARLELLGNTLRPTPHVPLSVKGIHLFAKLEYVNPVGSIKDRSAYWILKRAAERGEICDETTVIESSSGNFACALAAFTHLVGLQFIPVIDPNISGTYESFLRRLCPTVVKVEDRDDTGGFLKTRLQKVKELCATIPNAYWTNQYGNLDAIEAHYELTGAEICADFDSLDYVFIGVSTAGTIAGVSRRLKERYPNIRVIAVDAEGSAIFGGAPRKRHIPGIGSSIVPQMLSYAEIDEIVWNSERGTDQACQELLTSPGLSVGGPR